MSRAAGFEVAGATGHDGSVALERRRRLLLASLVESPETVISIHVLTRGDCNVYMSGDRPSKAVAVLQARGWASEPTGFGSDADVLWQALAQVKGWDCVLVDKDVAPPLGGSSRADWTHRSACWTTSITSRVVKSRLSKMHRSAGWPSTTSRCWRACLLRHSRSGSGEICRHRLQRD